MGALLGSCSGNYWSAKWHMLQAESAVDKAMTLKDKKVDFKKRIPYYQKACDHFMKVYQTKPDLFTLNRIESAVDACWKSEREAEEETLMAFQEEYVKTHPHEQNYGDPGEILSV